MIHKVQDLFLSCRTCGLPNFGNMPSQILNQMTMECADSSSPRKLQALQSSPPTATVLQVSSPAHTPHAAAGAPCSLTCLSLYLAWQRLRFWVCPSLQLLVSAWSKRAMSTQGARGKESILVTTFRVGRILERAVPLFFLPPSLSTARCPWFCNWAEEKGDEVIWVHSHCTQGCSRLFLFARKY